MINTPSGSRITDFTLSVRARPVTVSMASIALVTRLTMTCCNRTHPPTPVAVSDSVRLASELIVLQFEVQQSKDVTDHFVDVKQRLFPRSFLNIARMLSITWLAR